MVQEANAADGNTSGSLGIEETKELLAMLAAMLTATAQSLKDGRVGLGDLRYIVGLIGPVRRGLSGIYRVPAELSHLNGEQVDELVKFMIHELGSIPEEAMSDLQGMMKIITTFKEVLQTWL